MLDTRRSSQYDNYLPTNESLSPVFPPFENHLDSLIFLATKAELFGLLIKELLRNTSRGLRGAAQQRPEFLRMVKAQRMWVVEGGKGPHTQPGGATCCAE